MRTELRKNFYTFSPRIATGFKQHARLPGNERKCFHPAIPNVTSASFSTRVMLPSNAYGKSSKHLWTKASISMKTVILLLENEVIAVSPYRTMLHQNRTIRQYGTERQEIGCTKRKINHSEHLHQSDTHKTKRPNVFLKRRGVSTKPSGRFKKTSGGCPQNVLLTPSKPNFRRKTFVRLNICRTFTFRILHHKNK